MKKQVFSIFLFIVLAVAHIACPVQAGCGTTTTIKTTTTTKITSTTTTTSTIKATTTTTTIPSCETCADGTICGRENSLGQECICAKMCAGSQKDCPIVCELGSVPTTTTTITTTSTSTTVTTSVTTTTLPTCSTCPDGTSCGAKNPLGQACVCSKTCEGSSEDCPFVCELGSVPTTTTSTTIPTCSTCPDGTPCGQKNSDGRPCLCDRICVNPWRCTFVCVLDRLPTTTVVTVVTTTTIKRENKDERSTCCGFHEPSNIAKEVASYYCGNDVKDGGESDVDCGGPCGPCADGRACVNNGDCRVADCTDGLCRAVHCSDGAKNLGESAIDCRGPCGLCADGMACGTKNDCRSADCGGGVCRRTHCSNGKNDGDETDIDCGGSCSRCPGIGKCLKDSDCVSGECTDGRCGALEITYSQSYNESLKAIPYRASCKNGLSDTGEVDIDCGGLCAQCPNMRKCAKDSDCESNYCVDGLCTPSVCGNGKQDNGETGVDCGGSCVPCGKTAEQRGMSMVYGLLTFLIVVLLVFLLIYSGQKGEKEAVEDYKEMAKETTRRHRITKS